MEYLSEIVCGIIGLISGIAITITYQKLTFKDESYNTPKQNHINTGGGDFAGRDIHKNK